MTSGRSWRWHRSHCRANWTSDTSRIAVLDRIAPHVVAAIAHGRSMEKLEESDRAVTVDLRHPSRAERALRMEPVPAFVSMVIPGPGILLEAFPFVPADQVATIGAVDRAIVEVGPVEVLAKLTGQDDVGIKVKNPILAANLIQPALNHPSLVERAAAAMVIGEHVMDRMPAANLDRLLVVRRRDNHQVINESQVFGERGGQKSP